MAGALARSTALSWVYVHVWAVAVIAVASVAGYSAVIVDGESMRPSLRPADVVILDPGAAPEEGDVVTVTTDSGMVTHRAVEVGADEVVTRGDANPRADQPVPSARLYGVAQLVAPWAGWPALAVQDRRWAALSVWVGTLVLAGGAARASRALLPEDAS